jgi:hypothetical protein
VLGCQGFAEVLFDVGRHVTLPAAALATQLGKMAYLACVLTDMLVIDG